MTAHISVGSGKNSTFAADDIIPVVVRTGDTVVVANRMMAARPSTICRAATTVA